MAKHRPQAQEKPFRWETVPGSRRAGHAEGRVRMVTDMGHVFYEQQPSPTPDYEGSAGADRIQYPRTGEYVSTKPWLDEGLDNLENHDWKAEAEKDYMENVRPSEQAYVESLRGGVLLPCFDTESWDRRMEADAAKLADPKVSIPGSVPKPWAEVQRYMDESEIFGSDDVPDGRSLIKAAAKELGGMDRKRRERFQARQADAAGLAAGATGPEMDAGPEAR